MSLVIEDNGIDTTVAILRSIYDSISKLDSYDKMKIFDCVMVLQIIEEERMKYRKRLKNKTNKFTIKSIQDKIAEIDNYLLSLPIKEDMTDNEFMDSIYHELIGKHQ